MPGKVLMNSKRSAILTIVALPLLFACGSSTHVAPHFELSQYENLTDAVVQERLQAGMDRGEVILVEAKGDDFCILKDQFRRNKRKIGDTDYAGFLFYYDRGAGMKTITAHRLSGMAYNPDLIRKAVMAKEQLRKQGRVTTGIVLVLESVTSLSDEQVQSIVGMPFECLFLPNLAYVSVDQAKMFADFRGTSLCLSGLLWVGADHARSLANFDGQYLILNGIRAIDAQAIKELCRFKGRQVRLEGLYTESKLLVESFMTGSPPILITSAD